MNVVANKLLRVNFVSDLHLFCDRSTGDSRQHEIIAAASACDLFILGGDIFDFKWSRAGSIEESIVAAKSWLEHLLSHSTDTQVRFYLAIMTVGNSL